jgi:hypothetical protein
MCGAPKRLPAFGASTFQMISQWLNALNTFKLLNKRELNTTFFSQCF